MRRRLIVIGLVLLAVGLAAAYWFTEVPGKIAEDHRDRALPEHAKAAGAIGRVAATLIAGDLGADFRAASRADEPTRFLRLYRRASREHRRRLNRPRREIAAAWKTLRRVDRGRLFEVDSRPLLGGSDAVGDAKAIARQERGYLRSAAAALAEYEEIVDYAFAFRRVDDRLAATVARGFDAVPNRAVTDSKQLTGPLDRLARRLRPLRRAFLRLKPPAALRAERRTAARAVTVLVQEVRRASAAFARFDNTGAQRAQRRLTQRLRRLSRADRVTLRRLVESSSLRRRLDALDRRDARIRRAYEAL